MKGFTIILVLLVSLLAAGCVSSPAPTPVPTETLTATVSPVPTLIGNNDEAHIQFFYSPGTETEYGGMQKAAPGYLLYIYKVNVSSDKPVQTSLDWFGVEYKVNETDPVQDSRAFVAYIKYPEKTVGSGLGSARGEIFIELPKKMAPGYPKIYYYIPLEEQQGQYKVYDKVYGVVGDVQ